MRDPFHYRGEEFDKKTREERVAFSKTFWPCLEDGNAEDREARLPIGEM